jgi:hypothetical protein
MACLLAACGSSSKSACVPGASVACTATTGCTGAQVCKSDGSGYEACICGSPGGSGGGAAAGAGGAAGRGGSGGAGGGVAGAGGGVAGAGGGAAGVGGGAAGAGGAGGTAGGGSGGAAGIAGAPLAGLTVWLDAGKGLAASSSGAVTAWADQSAGASNASAVTATAPTLSAKAAAGHDALHFSSSAGTSMTVAATSGTDWESGPFLLELVLRYTTAVSTSARFWTTGTPFTTPHVILYTNDGTTTVSDFALNAAAGTIATVINSGNTVGYNDNSLHSVGVWRDASGNISLLVDGVSIMSQAQPEPLSNAGGATLGPFDGDLFEIIGKNGAATTADVAAVESYLRAKYGTP